MDPRKLKTEKEWLALLEKLSEETGMAATLTDDGGKLLLEVGQRFPLCKKIRSSQEALTFICSQSNTAMLAVLKKTHQPSVDECDAGLLRLAIPVLSEGTLAGQVVACGVSGDDVDTFLVAKQLSIDENEIESLLNDTKAGDEKTLVDVSSRYMTLINS